MLIEHNFASDELTYWCVRGMAAPSVEADRIGAIPRMAYWDVTRSDGAAQKIWVPSGQELSFTELETAARREFST